MIETQIIMGMPITIEIIDEKVNKDIFILIFNYFKYIDEKFSTYKDSSEITQINKGRIKKENYSKDMLEILELSEKTKIDTNGYFDIKKYDNSLDPSGIVKGWAIHNASLILKEKGFKNFCIEAGGDIETSGLNSTGESWTVGIRNPFKNQEIVKVLESNDLGIATSGTYIRGNHIYNPIDKNPISSDVVSLTVIGPNIYEADRFATAAFAMGKNGIIFIETLPNFEGYMIDKNGIATMTSGFEQYTK